MLENGGGTDGVSDNASSVINNVSNIDGVLGGAVTPGQNVAGGQLGA